MKGSAQGGRTHAQRKVKEEEAAGTAEMTARAWERKERKRRSGKEEGGEREKEARGEGGECTGERAARGMMCMVRRRSVLTREEGGRGGGGGGESRSIDG